MTKETKIFINESRGKRRQTTRKISKYLKSNSIQDVHHSTIFRFQKETGAKPYKRQLVPRKCRCRNWRERRLAFCNKYSEANGFDLTFWMDSIIFSDESTFPLHGKINRKNDVIWLTKEMHEKSNFQNILECQQDKHSQYLMVWGAFSGLGVAELQFLPPNTTIDGEYYRDTILNKFIYEVESRKKTTKEICTTRLVGNLEKWWFQQDGAPPHSAKRTQELLDKYVPKFI